MRFAFPPEDSDRGLSEGPNSGSVAVSQAGLGGSGIIWGLNTVCAKQWTCHGNKQK